jgi:hypothetical protein
VPTLSSAPVALLPFALLLLAVFGLWIHRALWMGALVAAVLVGYATGALHELAAVWMLVLVALIEYYRRCIRVDAHTPTVRRVLSGLALLLYAGVMGMALLPGFPRTVLFASLQLSPDACPTPSRWGFRRRSAASCSLACCTRNACVPGASSARCWRAPRLSTCSPRWSPCC